MHTLQALSSSSFFIKVTVRCVLRGNVLRQVAPVSKAASVFLAPESDVNFKELNQFQ